MSPLPIVVRLVEELDGRGVRFCHWKSNRSLGRSLAGEADLDLLVDRSRRTTFEAVVASLGFVRLRPPRLAELPDVEHFLGMDAATGRLSHLHVHYALVLGERRVKGHRLPLEDWVLEGRRRLEGMPVPAPEKELFLLYVRAVLKAEASRIVAAAAGRRSHALQDPIVAEGRWLLSQADPDRLEPAVRATGLVELVESFLEFTRRLPEGRFPAGYVTRERRRLLRVLAPHRRLGRGAYLARKTVLRARHSAPARRLRPLPRKRLPGAAPVVKLVGPDGSGKSTLSADLVRWLSWKLDTVHLYFGQPKSSPVLFTVRSTRRVVRRLSRGGRMGRVAGDALETAEWLFVARRRRALARKATRAAASGTMVVAERFPLPELARSMEVPMDGPRLRPGAPFRGASRERAIYREVAAPGPVYLLAAPYEVLRRRRPGMDATELRTKAEATLELAATGRYEVIDAARPYDVVLRDLKDRIWTEIAGRS